MSSSTIPSPARSRAPAVPATIVTSPPGAPASTCYHGDIASTAHSFQMSPLPDRISVLNDDTDIQIPGRESWWKRLGSNSRDVTEIMEEKENEVIMKATNVAEEIDVEVLSQEKENMSVDLPVSSDCESIQSIVIPQRKLFTNQDNRPQKKLKITVNRKENLIKMQKSYFDHTNKDINVMPKKLFDQAPKQKTKPLFTAALLDASANKTVNVNKSIEKPEQEKQGQVRNLFGNRPGTKRKNFYAEFLVSDSEDEIPEIQPRVFGFQKKMDHQQASKQRRSSSVHSSASNMTDVEIDEWQHLPSSTMVEHQLEDSVSRPRDSASIKNNSINKSKRSNSKIIYPESEEINKINTHSQSLNRSKDNSKIVINNNNSLRETKKISTPRDSASIKNNSINKSKRSNSKIIYPESEEINKINTRSQSLNRSKDNSKIVINNNNSLRETKKKNSWKLAHDLSKNKTLTEKDILADLVNEEHDKTLTEENQHSDECGDENFTLDYENDEQIFYENGEASQNMSNKEKHDSLDPNKTDKNSLKSNKSHIVVEITEKQSADVAIDTNQNGNKLIEKSNHSQIKHNDMDENVIDAQPADNYKTDEKGYEKIADDIDSNNQKYPKNTDSTEKSRNLTHDTTGRSKKTEVVKSPEAVLHDKSNQGESFTTHGRHTSMSKFKTMIKDLSIRPSLALARESTELIDNTTNSSAEGSGWDSHRTTRKTLRQTFGKDFTPRKSLRTLVMERAAKRQTNQNDQVADKSKRKSNFNEATDKSKDTSKIQNSFNDANPKSNQELERSEEVEPYQEVEQSDEVESEQEPEQNEEFEPYREPDPLEVDETDEESDQEMQKKSRLAIPETSLQKVKQGNAERRLENDFTPRKSLRTLTNQNDQVADRSKLKSNLNEATDKSKDTSKIQNSFNEANDESNQEQEQNEEVESDQEVEQNEEVESDQEVEQNEEVESDQEVEQNEEVESDQEVEQNEEVESDQVVEQNEEVESYQEVEQIEEVESDQEVEQNEEVESYQEVEQNEEVESDQEVEQNEEVESDQEVEHTDEVESEQEPERNEECESYREPEPLEKDDSDEESDHEASRQAALKIYLEKVRRENAERRRRIQEEVMNSLSRQPLQFFNAFKMPEVPKPKRATQTIKKATKPKLKPSLFSNELPPTFFEDLKYKPPKRFQGKNAPWITKRLYKFLEDKLRPKYDYHARVRAEKLVEKLYHFAKEVRKCACAAPEHTISELKHEMARLRIVDTHYDFYNFFHEFMPREIRIRVNPDIMNKIPKPRSVFSNILEE